MSEDFEVTKLTGELADADRVIPDLWAKGCCAIDGRGPCKRPLTEPTVVVVNQPFSYLLWRSVDMQTGACLCFLCDRHYGSVDEATQDMPPGLFDEQIGEAKKAFRRAKVPYVEPGAVALVNVRDFLPK